MKDKDIPGLKISIFKSLAKEERIKARMRRAAAQKELQQEAELDPMQALLNKILKLGG